MKLTHKLMVGIGIGSVLMNAIRIILLGSVNDNHVGAEVFFSLSSSYLLFCFILSVIFVREYRRNLKKVFNGDSLVLSISD